MSATSIHLPKAAPGTSRDLSPVVGRLSALEQDQAFLVTIAPVKSTRSLQQNAYLWGVCYPAFTKHLPGWDAEDIHEYFLGEWSGWEMIEGFGRKRLRPIRRSSKLSKMEFANYVDFIIRKAAEMGIVIESPSHDGF